MEGNENKLLIGAGAESAWLDLRYANRHGLITGATGTGKTVTVQILAEAFSRYGVPVVLADVKGDLSGVAAAGQQHPGVEKRVQALGLKNFQYAGNPAVFWDVFGVKGHPLRTTISDVGPWLISRTLELSEAQEGVLHIAFKYADDQGLLLLDLKDLRAMLDHVGEQAKTLRTEYGQISPASIGAIQRRLLVLEEQGGTALFGEPAIDINDFIGNTLTGQGIVNVLAADQLLAQPRLFALVHLSLLAELFEELPEVGDADKPRLILFLDEAHLLFRDASKFMLDQIEQIVRLIRSKGVGLYFITQHPDDVPEGVLRQLGNRIHHGMRAYTPQDQKEIRALVQGLPITPGLDAQSELLNLGVGEALVSMLGPKGVPGSLQKVAVCPPTSRIGPLLDGERVQLIQRSPVKGKYDELLDRDSAYENLKARIANAESSEPQSREKATSTARASRRDSPITAFGKSLLRSVGSALGRQLVRGVLGALKRR